jgi:SAM-dependent methyltransferase
MGDRLFEEWQIYEKLLIHDYMDHRGFFNRLGKEILSRFGRPVAILDLGCGDLTPIMRLLENVPVNRYVGIDESDVALAHASTRLENLNVPYRLVKGDLLAKMAEIGETFDIVLASFSLHHLADPKDKQRALAAGGQLLNPDGVFALVDVFCADDEARASYLERWIDHAEERYLELQNGEMKILADHVRSRDFPISLSAFEALGKQAGLGQFNVLMKDHADLNCLITFSASE